MPDSDKTLLVDPLSHLNAVETTTGVDPFVDHPDHYNQGAIECIDALEAASTPEEFAGWLRLTAMKYLWRANEKGETLRDLRKAQWCIERLDAFRQKHPQLFAKRAPFHIETLLKEDARG